MARHKRRKKHARRHPKGYGDFGVLPFAIPVLPAIAAALGLGAYFVTKKNAAELNAVSAGNPVGVANFQQELQTAQLVTSAQMAFEAGTSQQYAEALANLAAHWGTTPDAAAAYLKLPVSKAATSMAPPAKSYTPVIQGQLLPASSALPSNFFEAQVPRTNASPATSKLIGLFDIPTTPATSLAPPAKIFGASITGNLRGYGGYFTPYK